MMDSRDITRSANSEPGRAGATMAARPAMAIPSGSRLNTSTRHARTTHGWRRISGAATRVRNWETGAQEFPRLFLKLFFKCLESRSSERLFFCAPRLPTQRMESQIAANKLPRTSTSVTWRKRVGVEPTIRPAKDRIAGFEGRGDHRTPFASAVRKTLRLRSLLDVCNLRRLRDLLRCYCGA